MRTILSALLAAGVLLLSPNLSAATVSNFNLLDQHGKNHELYRAPGRAVVLFFTTTGCPIARKSSPKLKALQRQFSPDDLTVWMINAGAEEEKKAIDDELGELGLWRMTYLWDRKQVVALALGIERTAEVVAIETGSWKILYQGAVDDQFSEGAELPKPTQHFLADALRQFLAGKEISPAKTAAHGCRISYAKVSGPAETPDYATQVAPILREHCASCHRQGGIGPWSMSNHRRVSTYADMIAEVLQTRRMPPWDPHPDYGDFRDGNTLTREQTQTLMRWVAKGAPRGSGPDPLEEPLPAVPKWRLGSPTAILSLPEVQKVAATGIEAYRHLAVPNPFTNEVWLSGLEIKPGNAKVVHHVILYAKWPGAPEGNPNGVFFVGWAPGASPLSYPQGVAKRLPAHATLTMEMHYTTCGSEQTDATEIALFCAAGPQERHAETRSAMELNLDIPPGAPDARHAATYAFTKPATIYGLFPHMHFRGKSMRYELLLPDGRRETLLSVPRYDFKWQHGYYLKTPRHVPAGSWLLVSGSFDNSKGNPDNPDPKKQVYFGEQSWDEMFIGFFEAADDPAGAMTAGP